jgi:hypothetical protein
MKQHFLKATLFSAVAAALIGISAPAFADATPEDVARFVTVCDISKDGKISRAEVMMRAGEAFSKFDTAQKGMVDSKQFMAFLLGLQKTDGGSGYMTTKADMMKMIEVAFNNADANKKGLMDAAQLRAFITELMKSGG